MALQTRSFSSATTSNEYTLVLEVTENSASLVNGEAVSDVSWVLKMTSGQWDFAMWSIGWEIMLNGAVVSACERTDAPQHTLRPNSSITINTGSTTIKHNPDGTLTMSISAKSMMRDDKDYLPGNMSLSGNMELTTVNTGLIYIDNGKGFDMYQIYIDNGNSWDLCIAYLDTGSGWSQCC